MSGPRELPDGRILEEDGTVRSRVKTDAGRPLVTPLIRAAVERAREAARGERGTNCAACPAATVVGVGEEGLTVRCGVERSLVTEQGSPSSLLAYCLNESGYTGCPTWRREKERIWARRAPEVGEREGV